jgi:hypothetical protein
MSAQCPSQSQIQWDFLSTTAELMVWLPSCSQNDTTGGVNEWIKIQFEKIEEVDRSGQRQSNWPAVSDLSRFQFTRRMLTMNEMLQITQDFTWAQNPVETTQITALLDLGTPTMEKILFTLSVFYFDNTSSVSWYDSNGMQHSLPISKNSLKFSMALSGVWPWIDNVNHHIIFPLRVSWSNGSAIVSNANATSNMLTVDVMLSTVTSRISFPMTTLKPILVDDEFQNLNITTQTMTSSVEVFLHMPLFKTSISYDPTITFSPKLIPGPSTPIPPTPSPPQQQSGSVGLQFFWGLLVCLLLKLIL